MTTITKEKCNGFLTCLYGEGEAVFDSVAALPDHPVAHITARRLDVTLYSKSTAPILVKCVWDKLLENGHTVPRSLVIPLLLEHELKFWREAEVAETWESMRSEFLGKPCGKRSSLFVTQEMGQTIKKIWESLIYTGMFGSIKV